MNISAEARKHGIAPLLAHQRIRRGWTVERATSERPRVYFYEWRGLVRREDRPQTRSEVTHSAKSPENDTGQRTCQERQKANVCAGRSNGQG